MPISTVKQRRILQLTPDWMSGKITTYYVANSTKIGYETAQRYLMKYKEEIEKKAQEVAQRIVDQDRQSRKKKTFVTRFLSLLFRKEIYEGTEETPVPATQ